MQGMKLHTLLTRENYLAVVKYGAVLLPVTGLLALYLADLPLEEVPDMVRDSPLLRIALSAGSLMMPITISIYVWLAVAALRYRPVSGVADAALPSLTVVVPAYNEGRLVLETLSSLVGSDYPREKLQVIAVDDGSQDDTWQWIEAAERANPGRITAIRLLKNGGKRRALYEGFTRATGTVLVTVDSDSIVRPDTLRNLASPFVGDDDCGAVAGNVRVWNRQYHLIPKMLDVGFVFSFEFIRSAQSFYRTVLCTPGALAAYRRDLVMEVLNEWLRQKFFGQEARIGEDRALTNLILKQGKSVLFQSNAVVLTNVPVAYRNLCKMLIRWGRSNVRENLKMSSYVFTEFRSHHRKSARVLLLLQFLRCFPAPVWYVLMLCSVVTYPLQTVLSALGGIAIWGSLSALIYARRYRLVEALWAYAYAIFYLATLSWITSYSLFTMHRSGWLTRSMKRRNTVFVPQQNVDMHPVVQPHEAVAHVGNIN